MHQSCVTVNTLLHIGLGYDENYQDLKKILPCSVVAYL